MGTYHDARYRDYPAGTGLPIRLAPVKERRHSRAWRPKFVAQKDEVILDCRRGDSGRSSVVAKGHDELPIAAMKS